MGKKVNRVRYNLDPKDIRNLPQKEIAAILRGADDLIMSGGRSMLAKILKGSRDKKLLERSLNNSPVYGFYKHLTIEQILARIDWVILEGYLKLEYDHRLPLLVYTPMGWEIERDTYTDELLHGFDDMLESKATFFDMLYLKDRNRGMILMLLDKVEATGDSKYIPLLEAWAQVDYKKIRARIGEVIQLLAQNLR